MNRKSWESFCLFPKDQMIFTDLILLLRYFALIPKTKTRSHTQSKHTLLTTLIITIISSKKSKETSLVSQRKCYAWNRKPFKMYYCIAEIPYLKELNIRLAFLNCVVSYFSVHGSSFFSFLPWCIKWMMLFNMFKQYFNKKW